MKFLKSICLELMFLTEGFLAFLNVDQCVPPKEKLKLKILMIFCFSAGIGLLVLKKIPRLYILSLICFLIADICAFIGWSLH
jgi:hypothetical protein